MQIAVAPEVDETSREAVLAALRSVGIRTSGSARTVEPWQRAALQEGVGEDDDVSYALSPRSTRGATRA